MASFWAVFLTFNRAKHRPGTVPECLGTKTAAALPSDRIRPSRGTRRRTRRARAACQGCRARPSRAACRAAGGTRRAASRRARDVAAASSARPLQRVRPSDRASRRAGSPGVPQSTRSLREVTNHLFKLQRSPEKPIIFTTWISSKNLDPRNLRF